MAVESIESYINKLSKTGYKIVDDSGVLMFVVPRDKYRDKATRKEVEKLIKEIKYDRSWGIKPEGIKHDSEKLSESKRRDNAD